MSLLEAGNEKSDVELLFAHQRRPGNISTLLGVEDTIFTSRLQFHRPPHSSPLVSSHVSSH